MEHLTVLYDEHCAVCRRARDWLATQPTHVSLELLAAGDPAARARYGRIPHVSKELVVAADSGEVWVGPAAFIMALWATKRYRNWALRLSSTVMAPMAERFFRLVSSKRHQIGRYLRDEEEDCAWCQN